MSTRSGAAVVAEYGTAPKWQSWPTPIPGPGEALVRFEAAGLNPVDLAIGAGRFYLPLPAPPYVAGAEAVGTIVSSVRWAPGTRVWSLSPVGRFSEFFVARDDALIAVPEGVDPTIAAAMGIAGLAGWLPIVTRGGLQAGERVLVLGASGIVGQVAIQTARARGAGHIVAVARSTDGQIRARACGADVACGITDAEIAAHAGAGIDLIVDTLWGSVAMSALGLLSSSGRLVQVGSAAAQSAELVAGLLRGRRIDIRGFSVFREPHDEMATQYPALCEAAQRGEIEIGIDAIDVRDIVDVWSVQAQQSSGRKFVLVAQ